jgi:uncharacterized damage-inducible protein DinB
MTALEEIRELFAYHRWANARMLTAAGELDQEAFARDLRSSFASVRDTLTHMISADWIWLERWRGTSPTAGPGWDVTTHAALLSRWDEVERDQGAFLDGLGEADVERTVPYRTLNGVACETALGELCRHVVNHGTYHRGQVATMLRQLGVKPPQTDLILYYRERAAAR